MDVKLSFYGVGPQKGDKYMLYNIFGFFSTHLGQLTGQRQGGSKLERRNQIRK